MCWWRGLTWLIFITYATSCLGIEEAIPSPSPIPSPLPSSSPSRKSHHKKSELSDIPTAPSSPTDLKKPKLGKVFSCDRTFVYEGKTIICDSYVRKDAERLRPIIQDVPAAIAELDTYQQNRRNLKYCAYVGSLGVLAAILANIIPGMIFKDSTGQLTGEGKALRLTMAGAGLGAAGASVLYGLSINQTNESHIGEAVQIYNKARPEHPIELQFSTGIIF